MAVTAIGEVLSYAFDSRNDEEVQRVLFRKVYEALGPGGLFLFDMAGPERAKTGGPHRTFAQESDWAVLVESNLEDATSVLTRRITTFYQVGELYRRDEDVHQLRLVDPARVLHSLLELGFDAQTIQGYGLESLPFGVVAFLARKPRWV